MPWYDYLVSGLAGAGKGWQEASRYQNEVEEKRKAHELARQIFESERTSREAQAQHNLESLSLQQREARRLEEKESADQAAMLRDASGVGSFLPRTPEMERMARNPQLAPFIEETSTQLPLLPTRRAFGTAPRQDPRSLAATPEEMMSPTSKGWTMTSQPENVKREIAIIRAQQQAQADANRTAIGMARNEGYLANVGSMMNFRGQLGEQFDAKLKEAQRQFDENQRRQTLSMEVNSNNRTIQELEKVKQNSRIMLGPEGVAEIDTQIKTLKDRNLELVKAISVGGALQLGATTTVAPPNASDPLGIFSR